MYYRVECYKSDTGQTVFGGSYPTFKKASKALKMYSRKKGKEWCKRNKLTIKKIKIDIKGGMI